MARALEPVPLEDRVELPVSPRVEGHHGPGAQHGLAALQLGHVGVRHRQRPEEPRETLHVAALLERLADGGHLGGAEGERRQRQQRRRGGQLEGAQRQRRGRVAAGRLGGALGRGGPAVRLQDARVQRRRRGLVPGAAHQCECARRSRAPSEPADNARPGPGRTRVLCDWLSVTRRPARRPIARASRPGAG